MIQRYIKKCSDFDEKVNRRNILLTLKTAEVAVADIQADGQLFLRYAIDLAQVLEFIPLAALGTAALAVCFGVAGVKNIKACECCMGKE